MDFQLLKDIVETPGAPGHEQPIRELVESLVKDHSDECYTDGIGNLIVRRKGDGKKVMAAAHMDEISLISTKVDENGFIRFSTLGGFDPETLITQRVLVHGKNELPGVIGSKPVHVQTDQEKKAKSQQKNLFIDIGLPADDVKDLVPDGSVITRNRDLIRMGNCITGKSLDNRISVYLLVEALRNAKSCGCDFYAVFTTQEEVGIRGARVAANKIQPDVGIAIDITLANDLPGIQSHEQCTKLGEGTAIKIIDRSVICTPELVTFLEKIADENEIKHQREVLTAGGTDTSGMQYLMGIGSHVGCISTPTRYVHSTVETCSVDDINAGISLLTRLIEQLHQYQA
jgi:tetrahedral aminopeptidase